MKIALVKQDVFQDLYVAPNRAGPAATLFSSLFRVGPAGLFTLLDADFLIVREAPVAECRVWERELPWIAPTALRQLRDRPLAATDLPDKDRYNPAAAVLRHADFAVDAAAVDWSAYDVVVSLNVAVPSAVVARHPRVLWCYLPGEAQNHLDFPRFGYDVALNQLARGGVAAAPGVLDFPYTFLGPRCLENLMAAELARPPLRAGIFVEINSAVDPAALAATGHPLLSHRREVRANLAALYDTKYFVKCGGRGVRGNSLVEAISAGALVLAPPTLVHHAQLLPRETWIDSPADAAAVILRLDRDPAAHARLLAVQRERVQSFIVDAPLRSLENALRAKRAALASPPPPVPLARRLARRLRRALSSRPPA